MRYNVSEGPTIRAQRVLIYGPEGIGKTTMASQMPDPLFCDVEDGSGHLYVRRLPRPLSWDILVDECMSVYEDHDCISTLVIDSADAAERLCQQHVCKKAKKPSIESWGYGKGYTVAAEEFQKLLDVLDMCIDSGVNVVMVAHSQMRKFERPDESGAYDRFEVKLNKHVGSKVKEWADAVLFLDYETFVSVDDSGKGHASGGKRVIRTSHNVSWDAKNRWGLPEKMTLDGDGIREIMSHLQSEPNEPKASSHPNPELLHDMAEIAKKQKEKPKETSGKTKQPPAAPKRLLPLFDLCKQDGIRPDEVQRVMVDKEKRDEEQPITDWEKPFIDWLVNQWPRVKELVLENRKKFANAEPGEVYDEEIPF